MTYIDAASRCWLEVDLDVICANYRSACEMLGRNAQVIPVLKANAYGMNAVVIAENLKEEGARCFAVATTDEAEQLIAAVPGIEVLPMGLAGDGAMERLIEKGMPLTLYSEQSGRRIAEAARRVGKAARVHVKVDTGLHRIGLEPEGAADFVAELAGDGWIIPVGLYTHLAIHTEEMDRIQVEKLCFVRDELAARGISLEIVHAVDSIGMAHYPQHHLDAARVGAWIYGVKPSGAGERSRCPARFKARVSQVRRVKKGELIGYDDDHPLERDSIVATVSAGYVDGTPRLGEGWQAEVCGRRAGVIELACMDQLMLDVTDVPGVCEGDEVTFVGGLISVEEYSRMGKLNRNEAWARIGRRVPRVFFRNGEPVRISAEV